MSYRKFQLDRALGGLGGLGGNHLEIENLKGPPKDGSLTDSKNQKSTCTPPKAPKAPKDGGSLTAIDGLSKARPGAAFPAINDPAYLQPRPLQEDDDDIPDDYFLGGER
jgi:hypothetical protein